jgi:DNA repair protein RadC
MSQETTSTNASIDNDEYKDSDLSEINQIDPRTALAEYGAEKLSSRELLAVVISPGCGNMKQFQLPAIY